MAAATSKTQVSTTTSTWDITSDIYDIVESVENIKKRYVEDENESTLALGIYGFITDLESKKIQTAIIQTGELGNEMFPQRAKLEKNILAHAVFENVAGINASPASIMCNIAIKVSDLDKYMKEGEFYFDRTCAINIEDYEFHFDYDVLLKRTQTAAMSRPTYSARYIMDTPNPISTLKHPYLSQPYVANLFNNEYVMFQARLHQVTLEWTTDMMVTDSIIENKTFIFEFSNQLADFTVYVTENDKTTRITPVFYGSPVDQSIEYYCWYLYITETAVRIQFDSLSYMPGLNAEVTVEAQTTIGADGNFSYDRNQYFYNTFISTDYGYSNVNCWMLPVSDSVYGRDRRTTEELRQLIPKFALSRGYITTETDLNNYFNLIEHETSRVQLQKKIDNQLYRIWYCYWLLKDKLGNIIPTNTVNIMVDTSDGSCYSSEDGRMVLPAGTALRFDPVTRIATVMNEADIPELYSDEYFNDEEYYYISVYNIAICDDPLYAAFYMNCINKDSYWVYDWLNEDCELQFIAGWNNIHRKLLTERNIYVFTFSIQQSVNLDYDLYYVDQVNNQDVVINKMRCYLVFYKNDVPYRYAECYVTDYDYDEFISYWRCDLETDNGLDLENEIKLVDLGVPGSTKRNYGYFGETTKCYLYTLVYLDQEYGRYDLDEVVPDLDGYSVTNRYEVEGGVYLYRNYTHMMSTKVTKEDTDSTIYTITGFPMVGAHYMLDEDYVTYFFESLEYRRSYIQYCLNVLENSLDVDYKFFNTYGPSITYSIGDEQETLINHIDIEMKFRIKLVSASDSYTKDEVIAFIKEYVENINDIGDLHIPNLITEIENEFSDSLTYVEFMNFNKFWLGVQHMELLELENPHIVPEFICIRNYYDDEEKCLKPCIEVEVNS